MRTLLESTIYFSYSQILIFDASAQAEAGLSWTDVHVNQGFARRLSIVSFSTLTQYGNADLSVYLGSFSNAGPYARVIAVPIYSPTGKLMVAGPEEYETDRHINIEAGHYELVAAQSLTSQATDEDEEDTISIEVFLNRQRTPLHSSRIVVADENLHPLELLIESADVAV